MVLLRCYVKYINAEASRCGRTEREDISGGYDAGIARCRIVQAAFGCDLPRPEHPPRYHWRYADPRRRLGQRAGSTPRRCADHRVPAARQASLGASRTTGLADCAFWYERLAQALRRWRG